jgi:hypothetical protein
MQHDDNTTKEAGEGHDRKNTTSAQEPSQLGIPPNGAIAIAIASEAELGALGPRVSSPAPPANINAMHVILKAGGSPQGVHATT